ncbi:hypothetical protein RVBP17_0960 [Pseudomonas phage sp. 30-3]|nr:hypothetical protein RVBP17_0960 [Pseudomonas phage sp. 30-3]
MKLESDNSVTIESTNMVGGKSFTIKNSPKAFSILSNGLYKDKIRAIVREIGCNARDSHVAANKCDVPFEYHVPTDLEPFFSIKDFGVGLDYNEVMNIYTTYFDSTKTQSNDFIGAFGLGSKSPFSYVDNFSIISTKDGITRTFAAFISESGVPDMLMLSEMKTNEPNGVEVKIPVSNRADYKIFDKNCVDVYSWMNVLPVEVNGHHVLKTPEVFLSVTNRATIYKGTNESHKLYARQGGVLYPIDIESISEEYLDDSYVRKLDNRNFYSYFVVIDFSIGELDVSASREELSYIPLTQKNLSTALIDFVCSFTKAITDDINSNIDAVTKTKVLYEYKQKSFNIFVPDIKTLTNIIYANISDSVEIGQVYIPISEVKALFTNVNYYTLDYGIFRKARFLVTYYKHLSTGEIKRYRNYTSSASYEGITYISDNIAIDDSNTVKYFIIDDNTSTRAIRDYISNIYRARCKVIICKNKNGKIKRNDIYNFARKYYISKSQIIFSSDLNIPVIPKQNNRIKKEDEECILLCRSFNIWKESIVKLSDIKDDCYYVEFSGWNMTTDLSDSDITALTLYHSKPIYGVRKITLDQVKKNKHFIPITDHVIDEMYNNVKDVIKQCRPDSTYSDVDKLLYYINSANLKDSLTNTEIKDYEKYKNTYKPISESSIKNIIRHLDTEKLDNQLKIIHKRASRYENILSKYPLIEHVNLSKVGIIHVVNYMNMIDNNGESKND